MYEIHYFNKLDSTNDKVKEFQKHGSVVIAGIQTDGRGRFKRRWSSGKGGLWLSILLKPENIGKIGYLTLSAAIACQKAVKKIAKVESKVKWPNDLVVGNKKLCGILTESSSGENKFAIVGIGMNTNNKIPKNLEGKAASLRQITGEDADNEKIAKSLLREFEALYKRFNNKEYGFILKKWKKLCDTIGRDVKVITLDRTIRGRVTGVDSRLRLIIKAKGNKTEKVVEGDIYY